MIIRIDDIELEKGDRLQDKLVDGSILTYLGYPVDYDPYRPTAEAFAVKINLRGTRYSCRHLKIKVTEREPGSFSVEYTLVSKIEPVKFN